MQHSRCPYTTESVRDPKLFMRCFLYREQADHAEWRDSTTSSMTAKSLMIKIQIQSDPNRGMMTMRKDRKPDSLVWRPFRRTEYRYDLRRCKVLSVIRTFFRDIRRCHQRIWKGYCDYDLFEIDSWFLGIMPAMLEEFRNTTHGFPPEIGHRIHESACGNVEAEDVSDEADKEGMTLWRNEIDKIIHLLREASEDTCSQRNPFEEEYHSKVIKRCEKRTSEDGFIHTTLASPSDESERELESKYFAEEKRLAEYRNSCKDEALVLLSKWFFALWD